jgi:hypothetical protein
VTQPNPILQSNLAGITIGDYEDTTPGPAPSPWPPLPPSLSSIDSATQSGAIWVAADGDDAHDGLSAGKAKATIQAAIAALPTLHGHPTGVIEIGGGTWNLPSTGRMVPLGVTAGTNVITDPTCTSADVGSYVLGEDLGGNIVIQTVNPGVSFTINGTPGATLTSQAIITKPGLVLPAGVKLRGRGAGLAWQYPPPAGVDAVFLYTKLAATVLQDNGSGITILIPSSGPDAEYPLYRFGLEDLAVWGNANNMFGVFNFDQAWWLEANNCDFAFHGIAGVALGENMNSAEFRNCIFAANGSPSATIPTNHLPAAPTLVTGGLIYGWGSTAASAAGNLHNCVFVNNWGYGFAYGSFQNVGAPGAAGFNFFGCQWNHTIGNASPRIVGAIASGAGALLGANDMVIGCYFEDSEGTNIVTDGPVLALGCTFAQGTNSIDYVVTVYRSGLFMAGCVLGGNIAGVLTYDASPSFSWTGCEVTTGLFWKDWGGASLPGSAGINPGSVNVAPITQPKGATSVALGPGSWQNATGGDIILAIPLSFAADGSATIARGPTNTPPALGTITRKAGSTDVVEYYVPAGWWVEVTLAGGAAFTANAIAQPV